MSLLEGFMYFAAVLGAIWTLAFVLDRVWPSNFEREHRKKREQGSTAPHPHR